MCAKTIGIGKSVSLAKNGNNCFADEALTAHKQRSPRVMEAAIWPTPRQHRNFRKAVLRFRNLIIMNLNQVIDQEMHYSN